MIYASPNGKTYPEKVLKKAIAKAQEEHPGWNLKNLYTTPVISKPDREEYAISSDHSSTPEKRKVVEIYKIAEQIDQDEQGIQDYIVSIAVDGRVDVKIPARSVEEAMKSARQHNFMFECGEIDVIDVKPVNISDVKGNLLRDF